MYVHIAYTYNTKSDEMEKRKAEERINFSGRN